MDFEIDKKKQFKRNLRKWLPFLGIGAGAILIIIILISVLKPGVKSNRIRMATVDTGPVLASIDASGVIIPANELVLTSPFETRILDVLRQPGAEIEIDAPLLLLDDREVRMRLERIRDEIELKENAREQLEINLAREMENMVSQSEILKLRVEYLEAQTNHQKELFDLNATTPWNVRQAELDENIARIEYEHHVKETNHFSEGLQAQIQGIEIELRLLKSREKEAVDQLARTEVRAEMRGVLTWIADEIGASVREGDVIARIANLEEFRAEATVSDLHSNLLGVGLPVLLTTINDTLKGAVASIPPSIERGMLEVNISLDDPANSLLRPQMRVDVHIIHNHRENTLRVPKGPFVNGPGRHEVFVVRGDYAVKRTVRLGLAGVDYYEVLEGLDEGERIILSDMRNYLHLDRIRIR